MRSIIKIILFSSYLIPVFAVEHYYSQVGQDKLLQALFPNKRNGVVVDVGASDGKRFSNSLKFEELGWTCMCIEPHPRAFVELQKNRPHSICIQACISEKEGREEFLQINGACELLSGLTSKYDPRHIARIAFEVQQNRDTYQVIPVNCYRLNTLLEHYDITHIDILSIDVEGGEDKIIRSIENLEHIVDVICVEDNYNDTKLVEYLEQKGFVLIARLEMDLIFRNTLFYSQN